MNKTHKTLTILMFLFSTIFSAIETNDENSYVIDQPGTITFTSGVKIAGKVEKPQVIIFMSKEEGLIQKPVFYHSFEKDILSPIELPPIINKE